MGCNTPRRRYVRTGSRQELTKFLKLAEAVEEQSEAARCAYMHSRIGGTLDSGKNFWKEMRYLGLIPKTSDTLHGYMPEELKGALPRLRFYQLLQKRSVSVTNITTLVRERKTVTLLGKSASMGEHPNKNFSSIAISSSEDPVASFASISAASLENFRFAEISEHDVILSVSHFKSQARGEDGIPQSIIARALPVIVPHLTKLCNASLLNEVFLLSWKEACILALKKSTAPSSSPPSDFRPIALLCFLSKVQEKLAHDQIMNYLNRSKISDQYQTGFGKYDSTQSALLKALARCMCHSACCAVLGPSLNVDSIG